MFLDYLNLLLYFHTPVSYTHLDVYKRQVMVSAILQSPFKDPIAYKIKNTVIALRNEDSKQILVEVLK